jgi:hypothetical protein
MVIFNQMCGISTKIQKIFFAGVITLVFVFFSLPAARAEGISTADVIQLLNQSRASNGLDALRENYLLDQAARAKADDMIANDYFAHTSPKGIDPWYWFRKAGYDYKFAGENLAVNFTNAIDQHKAWMNSPTHRKNILNDNYNEVGVAVAKGNVDGKNSLLTVELFGSPLYVLTSVSSEETQTMPQTQTVAGQAATSAQSPKIADTGLLITSGADNLVKTDYVWLVALSIAFSSLLAGPLLITFKVYEILAIIREEKQKGALLKGSRIGAAQA